MNTSKLEQGVSLHQEGKLEEAEQAYLDILVDEPENGEALKLLGVIACQKNNTEEGISYLEAAIEADPEISEYHLVLGRALFEAGKYNEGINSVTKSGEIDPGRADVYATLGYFNQHIQNFSVAQRAYERAAVIEPDNIKFRVGAGLSAYFAGQADTASEYLSAAFEEDGSIHQACYGLALVKADAGDIGLAEELIAKAIALEPENPEYNRLQSQLSESASDKA
jgi:tetratricopeptide (TPR) repeat protein